MRSAPRRRCVSAATNRDELPVEIDRIDLQDRQ